MFREDLFWLSIGDEMEAARLDCFQNILDLNVQHSARCRNLLLIRANSNIFRYSVIYRTDIKL